MITEYPLDPDIMKIDGMINGNEFNSFELDRLTKKNSLYFML
jgi:hypothetical protein